MTTRPREIFPRWLADQNVNKSSAHARLHYGENKFDERCAPSLERRMRGMTSYVNKAPDWPIGEVKGRYPQDGQK